jgi:hypothetical protein
MVAMGLGWLASRVWIGSVHFGFIQGCLIRRLFEVRVRFTLKSLQCAGCIPSVIHARFKHL